MAELIQDFGTDRVLFGSDYPWEDPGRAVDIIKSLDLSFEIFSLLYSSLLSFKSDVLSRS